MRTKTCVRVLRNPFVHFFCEAFWLHPVAEFCNSRLLLRVPSTAFSLVHGCNCATEQLCVLRFQSLVALSQLSHAHRLEQLPQLVYLPCLIIA